MNKKKNHKRQVMSIVLIVLFVISMCISYKTLWVKKMQNPWAVMTVENSDNYLGNQMYVTLNNEEIISQKIKMVSENLSGFAIKFVNVNKDTEGTIEIELHDSENNLVQKWQLDCRAVAADGYCNIMLEKAQQVQVGEEYQIKIIPMITEGIAPALELTQSSVLTGTVNVSGENLTSSLAYKLYDGNQKSLKYFWIAVVLSGVACVIILNFTMKNNRIASSFVVMCFLIGSIYIFTIPPFVVPDEGSHIVTVYSKSNEIMNQETFDENGQVVAGPEMGIYFIREEYPTASSYVRYLKGALGKTTNVVNSKISLREPLPVKTIGYIPQILGVNLGRIIGMNGEQVLLMGRLFALLWYCFIMYCAISIAPIKKMCFFIIGLLPMTIQQAISFSYDSVLLGFSFLLIAYLFKLIFDSKKISIKDLVIVGVLALGIGMIKYVYLPILALAFLIPKEKFSAKLSKHKVMSLGISALLAVPVTLKLTVIAQAAEVMGKLRPDGLYQYTIPYVLHHIGETIIIIVRTILENCSFYIESMIASPLGWVDIQIPEIIVWCFLIVLLLSSLFDSERHRLSQKMVVTCGIITFIVGGLVLAAMLISYTYIGSDIINGVQGRYFLPVLPLAICLVQSKNIVIKRNIEKEIMLSVCALQLYTIWSITVSVVSR